MNNTDAKLLQPEIEDIESFSCHADLIMLVYTRSIGDLVDRYFGQQHYNLAAVFIS